MINFFVVSEETCTVCGGNGSIQSEIWRQFFAAETEHREASAKARGFRSYEEMRQSLTLIPSPWTELDPDQWAAGNGFGSAAGMGPEEYECPECEGAKIVRGEVPLGDALAVLLLAGLDARTAAVLEAAGIQCNRAPGAERSP